MVRRGNTSPLQYLHTARTLVWRYFNWFLWKDYSWTAMSPSSGNWATRLPDCWCGCTFTGSLKILHVNFTKFLQFNYFFRTQLCSCITCSCAMCLRIICCVYIAMWKLILVFSDLKCQRQLRRVLAYWSRLYLLWFIRQLLAFWNKKQVNFS